MGMLLGSMYAGMAFSNSPCAGCHALAYPIGYFFFILYFLIGETPSVDVSLTLAGLFVSMVLSASFIYN